jgi:hypothetical protein
MYQGVGMSRDQVKLFPVDVRTIVGSAAARSIQLGVF